MATGDMNIAMKGGTLQGAARIMNQGRIDANSTKSGDFTEARNVGGTPVFLTKAGAETYDKLVEEYGKGELGFHQKAEKDPGMMGSLFNWIMNTPGEIPATQGKR